MIQISGTQFRPFIDEQVWSHAPRLPGVFILAEKSEGELYRPFFVGQAENLCETLTAWLRREDMTPPRNFLSDRRVYFQCHPVIEDQYRRELELLLSQTAAHL